MDLRGKSTIRGLRNNNPGNLEKRPTPWQGKIPHTQNTDGRFEQFETIEYGLRALMINARTLIQRGKNTLEKLIYTWAPPSENDSKNYADYVAKQTGIPKNQTLESSHLTKDFFIKVAKAITAMENGENSLNIIPHSAFEKAQSLMSATQFTPKPPPPLREHVIQATTAKPSTTAVASAKAGNSSAATLSKSPQKQSPQNRRT